MEIKTIVNLFIFFLIYLCPNVDGSEYSHNPSKNDLLEIIENGNIKLLSSEFDDLNLALLNNQELLLLKKSIYAKYGFIFNSEILSQHFNKFNWYKPTRANVEQLFSDIDKLNIEKINTFEKKYLYDADKFSFSEKNLIGLWHIMPNVASGWADKILFFEDKTFRYDFNEMDGEKRIVTMSGTWTLSSNKLSLFVNNQLIIIGGSLKKAFASYASEYVIVNGEEKSVSFATPKIFTFPITEVGSQPFEYGDEVFNLPFIQLGNRKFWEMYDNPNDFQNY